MKRLPSLAKHAMTETRRWTVSQARSGNILGFASFV